MKTNCGLSPDSINFAIDLLTGESKKSGFFDLPKAKKECNHPSHEPPGNIYIPPGKGYRHVCPACGRKSILIPPQISYATEQRLERAEDLLEQWIAQHKEKLRWDREPLKNIK